MPRKWTHPAGCQIRPANAKSPFCNYPPTDQSELCCCRQPTRHTISHSHSGRRGRARGQDDCHPRSGGSLPSQNAWRETRWPEHRPNVAGARQLANKAPTKIAADRNAGLRKVVAEVMEKTGLTKLAEIAEALNLRGIKTNRGCGFTPTHIHRLLKAA